LCQDEARTSSERGEKREFDPPLIQEFEMASGSKIRASCVEDKRAHSQTRLLCPFPDREVKKIDLINKVF
jgi:hypothetical protein